MHPRLRARIPLTPASKISPRKPVLNFCRTYAAGPKGARKKAKDDKKGKKKKGGGFFIQHDLKGALQFSLAEAMRYIRAMEVGRDPVSVKYDLAVRLRTPKTSPIIRNRVQLPTPVKTDKRVCVIAEGEHAEAARQAGAAIVGTDAVFEQIRKGNLDFELCIAHEDSFKALVATNLAKVLGPRGLMPSSKLGTVVKNTGAAIRDLVGQSDYKERLAVVRLPIGQLRYTEAQLAENIKTFIRHLKKDIAALDNVTKTIHEVVLSSTNSSGFSLNGWIEQEVTSGAQGAGNKQSLST
ncbi:ribosomal protein L1-like protein [Tuber brumale]|nr:ribosomal protein L1-like protein [Tuber brumale]